ncbi:MAG: hypothetical protein NC433_04385 [Clostridiales bacterium]|nr:hypothetical protein [Clostridiales bacterium]
MKNKRNNFNPYINAAARRKYVRNKIKKIWLFNGVIFLIAIIYAVIWWFLLHRDKSLLTGVLFIVSFLFLFSLFGLADTIKLLSRNRKIDKLLDFTDKEKIKNDDFLRSIESSSRNNPLLGAQLAAQDIWNTLLKIFQESNERIKAKTLLLWASGLAGYACQASVWEKVRWEGKTSELLYTVKTKSGKTFYVGEGINKPLFYDNNSIWNLAVSVCQKFKLPEPLPKDIDELVKKSVEVDWIDDENYKIWNEIAPEQMFREYELFWKLIINKLIIFCGNPEYWHLVFGLVLQNALQMAIINDKSLKQNCLKMAMENALYTSKMCQSHDFSL